MMDFRFQNLNENYRNPEALKKEIYESVFRTVFFAQGNSDFKQRTRTNLFHR